MSKYIDREDLLKNLKQFAPEHLKPFIISLIEKQPTADVVEVVRCKDCTEWDKDEYECSPYCPLCKVGYEYISETESEFYRVDGECYTEWRCLNLIKKPPQSWCYVQEGSNND